MLDPAGHSAAARVMQVANMLYDGHRVPTITAVCGVSIATMRAKLKAIMAKAHCHSQIELICRICQLVIPFR